VITQTINRTTDTRDGSPGTTFMRVCRDTNVA